MLEVAVACIALMTMALLGTCLREDIKFPHGSVPYSTAPQTPWKRAKQVICASLNHHPRFYDGSWCFGYGYVCSRCHMYADPIPKQQLQQMCDHLNTLPPEAQQLAAARLSGGGPPKVK